jgi:hypothetical protein
MRLFFILLLFFSTSLCFAQPTLVPLTFSPASSKTCKSLSLPFFDDFASATDTNWLENKGVWINNSMAIRAPSIFVASFDGSDSRGVPYNFSEPARVSTADSLISHCFDLSAYRPSDSLIITFLYQSGGLGEQPNEEDSLILFAKSRSGLWKKIWRSSPDSIAEFKTAFVSLIDSSFFHKDFQFGFYNIARSSGPFDVWNLDYVYFFEKNRDIPSNRFDVAVASPFSALLGNYSAMPMAQFRATNLRDSAFVEVKNLSQELKLISHPVVLRQYEEVDSVLFLVASSQVETFSQGRFQSDKSTNLIEASERLKVCIPMEFGWMRGDLDSCWVEAEIALNTQEDNRLIRTTLNDTLRYKAALKDYFAYDDGTAEYGIGMRQRFGRFAVRFILNRESLLTDIDLYFPRIGFNQQGQIFRLCVWKHIDQKDVAFDKLLFVQTRTVEYSDTLNRFKRLSLLPQNPKFEDLLILSDTFYIGIQQLTEELMPLGFDENNDSQNQIFYNIGSKWEKNSNIAGSIMLRPVFRPNAVQVGLEPNNLEPLPLAYPNPTTGKVKINNPNLKHLEVFDLNGRLISQQDLTQSSEIDLSELNTGIYLLKMTDGTGIFWFKISKQ